ncbi:MAG TPA: nucleoside triphosphate pyrophosphohydrolase, partial [Allosphingosinicella sp.]|nr:nucleoside triphosphate pyrophosphohydrolase [Allosphingosinicella sp.]
ELGDLLFSVVNYARHLGIDPEAALRAAVDRFEARFRIVESLSDRPLESLGIEELEALWQRAKQRLEQDAKK